MHEITSSIFYVSIKILAITEMLMNKDFQAASSFYFKKIKKYKMNFPEFFVTRI